jgi:hypothetical protein
MRHEARELVERRELVTDNAMLAAAVKASVDYENNRCTLNKLQAERTEMHAMIVASDKSIKTMKHNLREHDKKLELAQQEKQLRSTSLWQAKRRLSEEMFNRAVTMHVNQALLKSMGERHAAF